MPAAPPAPQLRVFLPPAEWKPSGGGSWHRAFIRSILKAVAALLLASLTDSPAGIPGICRLAIPQITGLAEQRSPPWSHPWALLAAPQRSSLGAVPQLCPSSSSLAQDSEGSADVEQPQEQLGELLSPDVSQNLRSPSLLLCDLNPPCENTAAPGLGVNSAIQGFIQGRHNVPKSLR